MTGFLLAIAIIAIIALSLVGAVVASVIVAQNWRIIVYLAIALTAGALGTAIWRML